MLQPRRLVAWCRPRPRRSSPDRTPAYGSASIPWASSARRAARSATPGCSMFWMPTTTCCAPASARAAKRSAAASGVSVPAAPSAERRVLWSVERSISSNGRPTASQCSRRIAYLRRSVSGPPKTFVAVGVLGHEAERLLLAAAADHDRDARPAQRLGRVEEAGRRVVGALEALLRAALAGPHRVGDPERLLEHLEADAERRHREAERRRSPPGSRRRRSRARPGRPRGRRGWWPPSPTAPAGGSGRRRP